MFVFNVPPTAKVIWIRGLGLKSHRTDWLNRESNLAPGLQGKRFNDYTTAAPQNDTGWNLCFKLGIFQSNQTSMCIEPLQNQGWVGTV